MTDDTKIYQRRKADQIAFQADLQQVLYRLREMLVDKNQKYGDAALNPDQTFSTASPVELINVRMDDKLSRIRNRATNEDEDPEWDLIGYLILKQIAMLRGKKEAISMKTPASFPPTIDKSLA